MVLIACASENHDAKIPPQILPPDSMAILFKDLHLIHIYISRFHPGQYDSLAPILIYSYLQSLNLDTTRFFRSYEYYLRHPQRLQEVYRQIPDLLRQQQTKWESRKPKTP